MFGVTGFPVLLVAVFCAVSGVRAEGQRFSHDYETPEYTLKSNGVLRRMIQLDNDVGVEVCYVRYSASFKVSISSVK